MTLERLCKAHGWKYVEYLEVGTSDSIELRPKMTQLLREVEDEYYDAVLVVDYDRLGRGDLGEQDRIKKAFQKSDTLIITPDKIYNLNDDLDDTYADFKGLCARQELKMITKRLRQGKKIGALRGDWTNGTPPFPYVYQQYQDTFNEKGLVVHRERYVIYREFIEMALCNKSPAEIAIEFNNRGIRTPKGNLWSNTAIYRILVDETGLGRIISNKTTGDGHRIKKPNSKPVRKVPRSEWTIVENCHEAVKTQQEHDRILRLMENRKTFSPRARHQTYGLSGLIKCERCGRTHSFYVVVSSSL